MGRQNDPFNQPSNTGRLGYRRDYEPTDERPLLIEYACRCNACLAWEGPWRDQSERLTYEDAVEANPRQPEEGVMAYVSRLSAMVEGKYQRRPVQAMPHTRMSRVERDRQLAKLRGQMPSKTEIL